MTRTVLSRAVLVSLASLLALAPAPSMATGQLREQISAANLRFVGVTRSGQAVATVLSRDDIALLVATHEPRGLNELISGGIPVRASRIQELIGWGLMRQTGMQFQSLVPVLDGEGADEFERILERVESYLYDDVTVAITAIHDRVWRHPGVPTLPALTAWILRERAWFHLSGRAGLDIDSFIAEQQANRPERGFWGLLWYSESPPEFPYHFYESRRDEYAVQVAWNQGERADPFSGEAGAARLQEFLDKLERDGRRLDDADQFPDLLEAGLIEPNGDTRAMGVRYRIEDMEGLARIVEQAAADVATSFLSRLPRQALAQALGGVPEQLAVTLAYIHMVPRLVEELAQRGLPVKAGDPDAMWRELTGQEGGQDADAGEQDEEQDEEQEQRGPVRVTIEGPGTAAGAGADVLPVPPFSMMIWKDLPRRSILELPW